MQMCGVDVGMMPATARTWQAAPSGAEGALAWGQGALYGHTTPHSAAFDLCVPRVAAKGKANALQVLRLASFSVLQPVPCEVSLSSFVGNASYKQHLGKLFKD